jgi:hypothetical protein
MKLTKNDIKDQRVEKSYMEKNEQMNADMFIDGNFPRNLLFNLRNLREIFDLNIRQLRLVI